MKFVHVKIPVTVEHCHPHMPTVMKTEEGVLDLQMTMHDSATTQDVLDRLKQKLDDKLTLVDLGDED